MIEQISSDLAVIPAVLPTPTGQKTIEKIHWQNISAEVSTVQNQAKHSPQGGQSSASVTVPPAAPRYGHRVICVKDWLVVFGGGCQEAGSSNGQICDDLYAFNTLTYQWLKLDATGEPGPSAVPPGVAAASLCSEGSRIFLFGGMSENCRFTAVWSECGIFWKRCFTLLFIAVYE